MNQERVTAAYFDAPRPRVFAHRGLTIDAPENTIAAFRAALVVGAHYLETDARLTADGVAVLFHDPEIQANGVRRPIAGLSLAELRTIDLGGETVPTLAEALEAFPSARFNIDVKADGAPLPVARAIAAAGARDRVLLTSFDEKRRRAAVDALPGVASSASSTRFLRAQIWAWLGAPGRLKRSLRGIAAVQIPERAGLIRFVTRRTVRLFHRAGVEIHVWTVNDPADMERLLDLGVDGLVTDRSDLAIDLLARRKSAGQR